MTAIDNEHTIHVVQLIQEMLSGYAARPPQKTHYSVADWGKLWCAEKLAQLRVPDLEGFEEQALIDRIVECAMLLDSPSLLDHEKSKAAREVIGHMGTKLRTLRESKRVLGPAPTLYPKLMPPAKRQPDTCLIYSGEWSYASIYGDHTDSVRWELYAVPDPHPAAHPAARAVGSAPGFEDTVKVVVVGKIDQVEARKSSAAIVTTPRGSAEALHMNAILGAAQLLLDAALREWKEESHERENRAGGR